MVLLGFELSKSITLAKCFLETQPWKCMECTALLAGQNAHCCSICQSQNLTSPAWRSLTSHWIEWGSLWHCPTVWLKAGGGYGFGLMPESTWPRQRHMASVVRGLFIRKCLHAAAVRNVQSTNSNFLKHLLSSCISSTTFCTHQHPSSKTRCWEIWC